MEKFPEARQAFLDRKAATKKGDIGIGKRKSGKHQRSSSEKHTVLLMQNRLRRFFCRKICWTQGSSDKPTRQREEKNWKILGIGYGNGKVMLQRLNSFGIERDAFEQAVQEL